MKRFLYLALVLFALRGSGADLITAIITVTNAPTTNGQTLVINGSTRTWTNLVVNPSTQILIASSIGQTASNLFNQVAANPFTTLLLTRSGTNAIMLRGNPGQTITASASSWATITLSTQVAASMIMVRVPLVSAPTGFEQTNVGSGLVNGINSYSQAQFDQTKFAMSQMVGTTNGQTISGNKTNTGAQTFGNIVTTNLVNKGNAISSPGSGSFSEQFGTGASASGSSAFAGGRAADVQGNDSVGLGNAILVVGASSVGIGDHLELNGDESVGVGSGVILNAKWNVGIGKGASDGGFSNVVVLGRNVTATGNNQIQLGDSSHVVNVQGRLTANAISNSTYYGTIGTLAGGNISGTILTNSTASGLKIGPGLSFPQTSLTTLSSNNADIVFVNTFTKITNSLGVPMTNHGIAGGFDGRFLIIYNSTGQNMAWENDSGIDPTATNRIYTMTGSQVVSAGNSAAMFIYSGNDSRWLLISHSP
jgi:hypothetical protein